MKISEQQVKILIDILWASCRIEDQMGGLSREHREEFYNELLEQYDRKLIDISSMDASDEPQEFHEPPEFDDTLTYAADDRVRVGGVQYMTPKGVAPGNGSPLINTKDWVIDD